MHPPCFRNHWVFFKFFDLGVSFLKSYLLLFSNEWLTTSSCSSTELQVDVEDAQLSLPPLVVNTDVSLSSAAITLRACCRFRGPTPRFNAAVLGNCVCSSVAKLTALIWPAVRNGRRSSRSHRDLRGCRVKQPLAVCHGILWYSVTHQVP